MHYMHKYILKIYKFILLLELSKAIIENNFGGRSFPSLGYQLDKRLSNKKICSTFNKILWTQSADLCLLLPVTALEFNNTIKHTSSFIEWELAN